MNQNLVTMLAQSQATLRVRIGGLHHNSYAEVSQLLNGVQIQCRSSDGTTVITDSADYSIRTFILSVPLIHNVSFGMPAMLTLSDLLTFWVREVHH
jgi:hypothetical protein